MSDLVSIIIPVYNSVKYLDKTLDRVINQIYKNIEIILVDDGSTDGSGKMCDDFAAKDIRIKVFHQANSGPSVARNKGIEIAKGKYIGFVDSDDLIAVETYKTAVETIESSNADWVLWNAAAANPFIQEGFTDGAAYQTIKLNTIINKGVGPSACLSLFRREIIKNNSILFPPKIRNNEDYLFDLQYAFAAKNIYYLKKSFFYNYIPRAGSLSKRYNKDWAKIVIPSLIAEIKKVLAKYPIDSSQNSVQNYLNIKIAYLALSVIIEEGKKDNKISFKNKISNIKDFFENEAFSLALKNVPFRQLKKSSLIILKLAINKQYKLAYFFTLLKGHFFTIKRLFLRFKAKFLNNKY
jgi:glycosyltransferase EpsJ